MNPAQAAIDAFGESLGMPGLSAAGEPVVALDFERRGRLYLEPREEELLVYLAQPRERLAPEDLKRALALCHHRWGHGAAVQVGIDGDDRLVFLTRIEGAEVTLPNLQASVDLLTDLHQRLSL